MRLLILHDSHEFGGHERIFLSFFPTMLSSVDVEKVLFVLPETNSKFAEELTRLGFEKLSLLKSPFLKRRGEPYIAPFRLRYAGFVRAVIQRFRPDRILLLHGRIEHLATPAFHLPRTRMVSYVPMAHSMAEMQRSVLGGDLVRRIYYARPRRFIVPSAAAASQLERAGVRGDIRIVRNVVSPPPRLPQEVARRELGLPIGATTLLYMGRFDEHQKGIDRLLGELQRSYREMPGTSVLFIGDGPAKDRIQIALAEMTEISSHVLSWTNAPHVALSAADVLLMPSRFEGVPLVMLEAMTYKLPIVATPIDVFQEYLPRSHLFNFDNGDLAKMVKSVTSSDARHSYAAHCDAKLQGAFGDASALFAEAVLGPL